VSDIGVQYRLYSDIEIYVGLYGSPKGTCVRFILYYYTSCYKKEDEGHTRVLYSDRALGLASNNNTIQ